MTQPIIASDSSQSLETRLEPLPDVSIVIVHVNEHYESIGCCSIALKKLLEARVAKDVYEHSAYHESFLQEEIGLQWNPKRGESPRYSDFELEGIRYHIVDNETVPGDYTIDNVQGRRFIVVGGSVGNGNCHELASERLAEQIFGILVANNVRELHFPLHCIYKSEIGYDSGEEYMDAYIASDPKIVLGYTAHIKEAGRSFIATLDRQVVDMSLSFEEPTLHLAAWTSIKDMVSYLRNHEKLVLRKASQGCENNGLKEVA